MCPAQSLTTYASYTCKCRNGSIISGGNDLLRVKISPTMNVTLLFAWGGGRRRKYCLHLQLGAPRKEGKTTYKSTEGWKSLDKGKLNPSQ
jgi:hypothetical protein